MISLSHIVQGRTQLAPTEGFSGILGAQGLCLKVVNLTPHLHKILAFFAPIVRNRLEAYSPGI